MSLYYKDKLSGLLLRTLYLRFCLPIPLLHFCHLGIFSFLLFDLFFFKAFVYIYWKSVISINIFYKVKFF